MSFELPDFNFKPSEKEQEALDFLDAYAENPDDFETKPEDIWDIVNEEPWPVWNAPLYMAPIAETEPQLSPLELIEQKLAERHYLKNQQDELRRAAEAALLKIQEERNRLRDEIAALERELAHEKLLEAQREEERRRLQLMKDEDERLKQISDELSMICENFPAYFQAHMYQHDDLIFTVNAYREGRTGILNANDLGLGKTFESIVSLYILSAIFEAEEGRKPNVLWLTKKSLTTSTPREIQAWWPEAKVISSASATDAKMRDFILQIYEMTGAEVFLANYEFVRTTPKVHSMVWDFVVIDEVHKLKGGANSNGPTAIWTETKKLCHKARFNIFLSGTPMVNKPEEMWAYLHIFAPDRFPNLRQFERQFTVMRNVSGEYKLTVDADKILRSALKGQMFRRSRKEVGLQLPPLTGGLEDYLKDNPPYPTLEMNAKQREVYDQMKYNFFIWLDEQKEQPLSVGAIIAQLTRLRQISVWPAGIKITDPITEAEIRLEVEDSSKIDACMDVIEQTDGQVVVFCTFNEPMYEVKRRCEAAKLRCKIIAGDTKAIGDYEYQFQQGEIDVLCVNSAMGEGLNLQKTDKWPGGSSTAVFLDLWWSPARNIQCEGRIHRQGQTEPCFVYILHNENSIDNFIKEKLADKQASFESIMESGEIRPASKWREDLEGLL